MPESAVNVPGLGPVPTRYLYIGGGITAAIVAYAWWRHRRSGQLVIDSTTGATTNPAGFVNPNPDADGGSTVDATGGTGILTNDQWATAALGKLAGTFDPQFAQIALGKYLAGVSLTNDEANLVRAAWAVQGHPPQGDPQITLVTTSSTPGSGPPTPHPVTIPVTRHPRPRPPGGAPLTRIRTPRS